MLGLYIEILVAVEDSSISDLLFFTGIPNGIRHQRSGHIAADPVRQHHFSAQIQYGTQIGTVKNYAQKGLQTPAE